VQQFGARLTYLCVRMTQDARREPESGTLTPQPEQLSFDEFFRQQYPPMVRLMYGLTGDLLEAEDLAQEAMVRVLERWDRVTSMRSPAGYLYTVAVNTFRRRRRVRRPFLVRLRADEDIGLTDARIDVIRALARLPRRQREAVVLTICMQMTSEEAAEAMRVQSSSVRAATLRGKRALEQLVGGPDAIS
jgi:RNA polymerase sigma factor (sigma-70 family)